MICIDIVRLLFRLVKKYWKTLVLVIVPLVFIPLPATGEKSLQCAYVIIVVAIFWITEVMNLAVTSLIPLVLFPAFRILEPEKVASCYMKDITLMLVGGLIVALTIEKQNLHKRLALNVLKLVGVNPVMQYLGFMLSSWFLSMWISNTATTAMMLTLSYAVVEQWYKIFGCTPKTSQASNQTKKRSVVEPFAVEMTDLDNRPISQPEDYDKKCTQEYERERINKLAKGLFLSIAYASTCGGIGTLTGTAPNLVFYAYMDERYKSKMNLNFGTFMLFAIPVSILTLASAWLVLCIKYIGIRKMIKREKNPEKDFQMKESIEKECRNLGTLGFGEVSTLLMFLLLVILWIIREPGVPLLGRLFTEYGNDHKKTVYWTDATSAVLISLIMFNLPSKNPFKPSPDQKNKKIIEWKTVEKEFPWGLVFLFGGGFALADGCSASGLSIIIGNQLMKLGDLPPFLIVLLVSLGISFLTEFTSNTATSTILLPILLTMAECVGIHPMKIGLASAISCSFSFCLPAATPPNAIVFATGRLRVIDMVTSGICLNFLCVFILTVLSYFYSIPIFNTGKFPAWLNTTC